MSGVQTNIVIMKLDSANIVAKDFQTRLTRIAEGEDSNVVIKCSSRDSNCVRFVTYWEITSEDIDEAVKKIQHVIHKFEEKCN